MLILLKLFLVLQIPLNTTIPYYGEAFYENLETPDSQQLLEDLHAILTMKHVASLGSPDNPAPDSLVQGCPKEVSCYSQKALDYKEARRWLFGFLHLSEDEAGELSILDVYALKKFTQADFGESQGPGVKAYPFHEILNTEHTWPQSRFNKLGVGKLKGGELKRYQKGDLHHLFPTANRLNSYRGSYEFGETNGGLGVYKTSTEEFESTCRRGQPVEANELQALEDQVNIVFQPPSEHRGNVARALFYFSIRYNLNISSQEEYFLRKWHVEDPVDEFEAWRNNEIFKIQHNRNPFIDFPQLVKEIKDF